MKNHSDILREEFSALICREILGNLDETGRSRLEELRQYYAIYEPQHEQIIRRLHEDVEFAYQPAYADFMLKRTKNYRRRFILRTGLTAAAVIAVLMGIRLLWPLDRSVQTSRKLSEKHLVEPGRSLAYLTLANGEQIELGKGLRQRQETEGTVVTFDSAVVTYKRRFMGDSLIYNILTVPRGGEFRLLLSDGSMIWMNSDSRLKYPVSFVTDRREVFLEGEAYFEVAKDQERPFIVHTSKGTVSVLGTGFNVRAYTDEERVQTTLVEGRVAYRSKRESEREIVLQPGFQVEDRDGKPLEARQVEVVMFTGWKEGKYVFENMTLDEIMQVLCRWYNVEVCYKREAVRRLHFTGDLERYENIDAFLEFLEIGGNIRFTIEGERIIVE